MALMSDIVVELQFTALFKHRLKGLAKRYRQIQTDIQKSDGLDCRLTVIFCRLHLSQNGCLNLSVKVGIIYSCNHVAWAIAEPTQISSKRYLILAISEKVIS
jgi:hypothetical protein